MDFSDCESVDWEDGYDEEHSFPALSETTPTKAYLGAATTISPEVRSLNNKRKRVLYSLQDSHDAIKYHKSLLSDLLKKACKCSLWCSDEMLSSSMLSLLPPSLLPSIKCFPKIDHIHSLLKWFVGNFSVDDTVNEPSDDSIGSRADDLCLNIAIRRGSVHQLNQLFISLLRGLSFSTRYVCSLHPLPPSPSIYLKHMERNKLCGQPQHAVDRDWCPPSICWSEVFISCPPSEVPHHSTDSHNTVIPSITSAIPLAASSPLNAHGDTVINLTDDQETEIGTLSGPGERTGRWVHVDVRNGVVDSPRAVESSLTGRRRTVAYVVAVAGDGRVADVTSRYCSQPLLAAPLRLRTKDIRWWYDRLHSINVSVQRIPLDCSSVAAADENVEREKLELQQCEALSLAPLPQTLTAFKSHPVYVLRRHIGLTRAVHPDHSRPVASFRGEPVYLQEHVCELLSSTQWRKQGRTVIPLSVPVTTTKRSTTYGSDNHGDRGNGPHYASEHKSEDTSNSVVVSLYGPWQTMAIDPGRVVDGIIPMNGHGNVEVWGHNPHLVPEGAVLIPGKLAVAVAQELALTHAPAIVDFETRNGRRVPKLDGVVVLAKDAKLMREATDALQQMRDERAAEKKERAAMLCWERIVRLLLSRQRLRETYGN